MRAELAREIHRWTSVSVYISNRRIYLFFFFIVVYFQKEIVLRIKKNMSIEIIFIYPFNFWKERD